MGGGIGVAVGTIGVDRSEWGVGVWAGVSVGTGIEPVAVICASLVGVNVSKAMTLRPLPLTRTETAIHMPRHIIKAMKRNAIAEPLFCMKRTCTFLQWP